MGVTSGKTSLEVSCPQQRISVSGPTQVYKALSHGVQPVAVKVFPLTANAEQHAEFQREVVLLKSCRDGNIVQVLPGL
jgi:hypothetical protein